MKRKLMFLVILLTVFGIEFFSYAQGIPEFSKTPDFNPEKDITFKVVKTPEQVILNEKVNVELEVNVLEGFHITSEMFSFESKDKSFTVNEIKLPKGQKTIVGEIIGGKITINILVTLLKKESVYPFDIGYQACSEGENPVCFPPVTLSGEFSIKAIGGQEGVIGTGVTSIDNQTSELSFIDSLKEKLVKALDNNIWFALAIIFLFGILTSLTPCVYPVIPLTMAFIGASTGNDNKGKLRPFILSVFLVLGIAITYSILGVLAGLSGSLFGQAFQNPILIGIFTAFFVALALSMFGYFDIMIPSSIANKLQVSKKGYFGALLVGMGTGILAAPCAGPIVAALLTWIGNTRSIAKGFLFMFVYALGMGILFVIIGTFTGVLNSLPKSGNWMNKVKYFFGILFIFAAALFAKPYLGNLFWLFIVVAGVIPFILAVIFKYNMKVISFKSALIFIVLSLIVYITPQFLKNKTKHEGVSTNYSVAITDAINKAKKENKIVLVDFYADWCAACKELDEYTWKDEKVKKDLKDNYIMLKLDFTKATKEGKEMQIKYGVKGLPTVIFLNSQGKEITKFVGFIKADKFLEISKSIKK